MNISFLQSFPNANLHLRKMIPTICVEFSLIKLLQFTGYVYRIVMDICIHNIYSFSQTLN